MKRLLFIAALLSWTGSVSAQGLVPKPIPCFEPKIYTPAYAPGTNPKIDFAGYNCVDIFGPLAADTVNTIEKGRVDVVAGKSIRIGPGTHIGPLPATPPPPSTNTHYFHAYIGQNDFEVVWFEPNSTPGYVGQFEKLELGIKLPSSIDSMVRNYVENIPTPNKLNPFNPDSINVEADFYHLDNYNLAGATLTKRVYGFYYKEYTRNLGTHGWDTDTTSYAFRVRFAPKETGNWVVKLRIISSVGTYEVLPIGFKCVSSDNKGYVMNNNATTNDNRKFMYFSKLGDPFFAIGNNLNWTDSGPNYWKLESDDYYQIEGWMDSLSTYGANYAQISMLPRQYGLEWTDGDYNTLNNYSKRLTNAWEFDQVLELAEEKGMYINIHNEIHDDFLTNSYMISKGWDNHLNTTWERNPYNSANQNRIPGINDVIDFLYNESAKEMYKKKLRYIVSRWGYSTNIMIWELISEIDNMLGEYNYNSNSSTRSHLRDWFEEMSGYLKGSLGIEQMISGSYADEQLMNYSEKIWPFADVILLHEYRLRPDDNFREKWIRTTDALDMSENKPVLIDEHGEGTPTLMECSDYFFHNDTWATALMGTYGCGQAWDWKVLVEQLKHRDYLPMKDFFEGEYLYNEEYQEKRWTNNTFSWNENTEFESFYLVNANKTKALCWLHNVTYWWTNERYSTPNACIEDLIVNGGSKYSTAYDNSVGAGYLWEYSPIEAEVHGLKDSFLDEEYYRVDFYPTEYQGNAPPDFIGTTDAFGTLHFTLPYLSNYGDMAYKVSYIGHTLMAPIGPDSSGVASLLENIKENSLNLDIMVYPNPANTNLTVETNKEVTKYVVISLDGKVIVSKERVNARTFSINTSLFERGAYMLKLSFSDQRDLVKPFIKQD